MAEEDLIVYRSGRRITLAHSNSLCLKEVLKGMKEMLEFVIEDKKGLGLKNSSQSLVFSVIGSISSVPPNDSRRKRLLLSPLILSRTSVVWRENV
ncbi:hypothetical protein [Archaeoglobus sp.]